MRKRWLKRLKKAGVGLLSAVFVLSAPISALAEGEQDAEEIVIEEEQSALEEEQSAPEEEQSASEEEQSASEEDSFVCEVQEYLSDNMVSPGDVVELNLADSVYFMGAITDTTAETGEDVDNVEEVKNLLDRTVDAQALYADVSDYGLSVEALTRITSDMLNDNPEYFFVEDACAVCNETGESVDEVFFLYSADASTEREQYEQKAAAILAGIDESWSDEFKLLYLHDYLVTHCEYDLTYVDHSAYGCIVNGSTVCQGYALAYKDLAKKAGIEAYYVSSGAINHAWNLVTINGKQYYVDCTWDDYTGDSNGDGSSDCHWYEQLCYHGNFLRSQSGMASTGHSGSDWLLNDENIMGRFNNTEYDSATWHNSRSAFAIVGDTAYFYVGTDGGVYSYTGIAQTPQMVVSCGYNYYGSLVNIGNTLFLSKTSEIYRVDLNSKSLVKIRSLTDAEKTYGSIYGMHAQGRSLVCDLANGNLDINRKGIITVDVSSYVGNIAEGISLDKTIIRFDSVGEKVSITATVTPSGSTVNWSSSDESVATVNSNGQVTCKGMGRAVITASSNGQKVSCLVYRETTWQNDWTYVISETGEDDRIFLDKYNGSAKNLCIPAYAVINGAAYKTTFRGYHINDNGSYYSQRLFNYTVPMETFTTEDGVDFFIAYPGKIYQKGNPRFPQSYMSTFSNISTLKKVDLSHCDTSEMESWSSPFNNSSSLEEVDFSGCDFSKITSITSPFNGCNALKVIHTPAAISSAFTAPLPVTMYELKADGSIGTTGYTDLKNAPLNSTIIVPTRVTSVSIKEESLELMEGESTSLTAEVYPVNATDKKVVWSSNNTTVATVDANGNVTALKAGEAIITVTTRDAVKTATCTITVKGEPVDPVTPLTQVTATTDGVRIFWEADPVAEGYCVFRKAEGGSWKVLAKTTALSYEDKTGASGTHYFYAVRCTNADGSKYTSAFDNSKVAEIDFPIVSLVSPIPTLKAASESVQISWTAVTGSPKYRVFRKTESGSWKKLADVSTNSYTDTTGTAGVDYTYAIRCLSADGTKLLSSLDKNKLATITYPAAGYVSPQPTAALAGNGIALSWNAVSGSPYYRIFRKVDGGSWKKLKDVSTTTYTDTAVAEGKTYTYAIRCLAADGTTLLSSFDGNKVAEMTYQSAGPVSPKPEVSAVENGVSIAWTAQPGVAQYRVFKKTGTGSWKKLADTADTSYVDTKVTAGTEYSYAVRCLDADGNLITKFDNNAVSSVTK